MTRPIEIAALDAALDEARTRHEQLRMDLAKYREENFAVLNGETELQRALDQASRDRTSVRDAIRHLGYDDQPTKLGQPERQQYPNE